jgi:hypothetical protein
MSTTIYTYKTIPDKFWDLWDIQPDAIINVNLGNINELDQMNITTLPTVVLIVDDNVKVYQGEDAYEYDGKGLSVSEQVENMIAGRGR